MFPTFAKVFFIDDWRHPGWKIVLQKEARSRRVVDAEDEQILGINADYAGLQLPLDLNGREFRPGIRFDGEAVPEAEVARLNALVNGERSVPLERRGKRRRGERRRAGLEDRD